MEQSKTKSNSATRRNQDTNIALLDSGLGVLFLSAFPMILLLFKGSGLSAFAALLQLALFLAGLRLIHRGQQIQNEYNAAEHARAPRPPRKILGAMLIGIMVTLLAGHHFTELYMPIGFGVLATALSIVAFGMDPLKDKGFPYKHVSEATGANGLPESVRASLNRIDERLDEMVLDIADLGDADLTRDVEALKSSVMGLIRALCRDADGIRRLRKPVIKLVELLQRENDRLIASWDDVDQPLARRRYIARIHALGDTFEDRARKTIAKAGGDAFELEADLLWNRMPLQQAG